MKTTKTKIVIAYGKIERQALSILKDRKYEGIPVETRFLMVEQHRKALNPLRNAYPEYDSEFKHISREYKDERAIAGHMLIHRLENKFR